MFTTFHHCIAHCQVEGFGIDGRVEMEPCHTPLDGEAFNFSDQRRAHTLASCGRKDINRIQFGLVREQRPNTYRLAIEFCNEANLPLAPGLHLLTVAYGR